MPCSHRWPVATTLDGAGLIFWKTIANWDKGVREGKAMTVNQLDSYLDCYSLWDPRWWLRVPCCFLVIGIAICCVSMTVLDADTEENQLCSQAAWGGKTEWRCCDWGKCRGPWDGAKGTYSRLGCVCGYLVEKVSEPNFKGWVAVGWEGRQRPGGHLMQRGECWSGS